MSKHTNRFLTVIHGHKDTSVFLFSKLVDRFVPAQRTIIRSKSQIKFTSLDGSLVCRVELISVTVPCDDNLVLPVREKERNALEEDWLVEKGTV